MSSLTELRRLMRDRNLDVYVIPTADAHQSEYVSDHDKRRKFISGFSGSAGTAVVTLQQALLWTDGRYFLQAQQELDENWTLMKEGLPETPSIGSWIAQTYPAGNIGLDPFLTSIAGFRRLHAELKEANLVMVQPNLVDLVWNQPPHQQPSLPCNPLMIHSLQYAGQSTASKLESLRQLLQQDQCFAHVVTALDAVAWLFNLRGSDIMYNPVFISYAMFTLDSATLYIDPAQVTEEVRQHLGEHVQVKPYLAIFDDLKSIDFAAVENKKILLDPDQCNVAILEAIPRQYVVEKASPITLAKALKNPVELEGIRQAHLRDAAAVCSFFCWLEDAIDNKEAHDEITVADKLERFRSEQKDFVGLSFETISASGGNGSIIHYGPKPGSAAPVTADQMYLCDSGAQYRDGTTDITRTVHLGQPTPFEKECFTRVLKGHIALARAVFPAGTTGPALDVFARMALWQAGLDYRHGTGHGVGAFLNVHEGPHGISSTVRRASVLSTALQPGMVVSNEPGYYEDGQFGIRIESILAVKRLELPHRFGGVDYLGFENFTLVPIQIKLMDLSLLNTEEIKWINDFHAECWNKVGPLLEEPYKSWLQRNTQPIVIA